MERREQATSSVNTIAATIAVIVSLLLPPGVYAVVAYVHLVAVMETEDEFHGTAVNAAISAAPQLWTFQEIRFTELLSRHGTLRHPDDQLIRLLDNRGTVVAAVGESPAWPVIARMVTVFDAGRPVGHLEVQQSLRNLLLNAGLLSAVGLVLAAGSYVTLRVIPLRAIRRANAELNQRDTALSFANIVLKASMEGSPDGMILVDERARVVAYNQNFADMYGLPRELLEAGPDEPVLRMVASRQRDPEAFLARVRYFYDHPEEPCHDRLELNDGRILERHSTSLYDSEHKCLGRIWFVRDITERETLQEALRSSEVKFRNLVESTTDFIWEIDESGRYTYVSPAAKALFGYEPVELIGKSPFDFMSGAEAARVAAEFATIARDRRAFSQLENTVTRKDGVEVALETSGVPIFDKGGNFRGYRGIDRDVTPRKRAALALLQRDALLHVVAISSAEFVTSPSVDEVIPKLLEIVGNTIRIDRVTVLENNQRAAEPPMLRYVWQSADVTVSIDPGSFENRSRPSPEVLAWQAPLQQGKVVLTDARSAAGDVRNLLEGLGTRTILVVPILIDGKYWGQVGFESCKSERHWQDFEVEILRTLAELIGSAIQRERYVKEIADANQIIQNTPTILYRLAGNPSLPVTYVSHNIKLFGYDPAALTVSPQFLMNIVHPDDTAMVRDAFAAALEEKSRPAVIEYRMLTSAGAYRWIENRYTPIRNATGRLVEIEGILIDVTERKAAEEKIAHLARTDALTGLANRATFIERLRHAFAAARRGSPAFAVLYLDIDRFKDINDTLGHPLGDLLLNMVGERLRNCVRETDLVARLGGDEFAVLQAGLSDTADAGALATKICTALAAPIRLDGNQLHITASVGISTYASDIAGPDDMLSQADLALYRAKDEGRDQYRFHSEDLDHEVRERVALADELRGALERDELELNYQPQVELGTGQIVGMEALIRWNHPTRGPLKPTAFLPIAEKTGTIVAIGQWVLDRSCRQMSLWRKAGIAPPTLAVNVSLAQLKSATEFVQFVAATLKKWGVAAGDLELDVTESMLAHTTLSQNDVIERLQKLGVKIAIDDFGTKYSSLDYLRSYRVSRLKISQAMIEAAAQGRNDGAMVRAIVGIARELNIEVIAQGVETEAQWSFLTKTSPTTKVQGFYYSEPVAAQGAGELLQRGRVREHHTEQSRPH